MTATDVAAIVARHGIELLMHGGSVRDAQTQAADESYLCAVLKARWGIHTDSVNVGYWKAWNLGGFESAPTELAAVVALADRLAEVQA